MNFKNGLYHHIFTPYFLILLFYREAENTGNGTLLRFICPILFLCVHKKSQINLVEGGGCYVCNKPPPLPSSTRKLRVKSLADIKASVRNQEFEFWPRSFWYCCQFMFGWVVLGSLHLYPTSLKKKEQIIRKTVDSKSKQNRYIDIQDGFYIVLWKHRNDRTVECMVKI